jgi:hypothetical protein
MAVRRGKLALEHSHRVRLYDQASASDHFTIVSATPGHSGVGKANDCELVCFRAHDRRFGGTISRDHPRVITTIERGRRPTLSHHHDRTPRKPENPRRLPHSGVSEVQNTRSHIMPGPIHDPSGYARRPRYIRHPALPPCQVLALRRPSSECGHCRSRPRAAKS